jgi:hypothetical protein
MVNGDSSRHQHKASLDALLNSLDESLAVSREHQHDLGKVPPSSAGNRLMMLMLLLHALVVHGC